MKTILSILILSTASGPALAQLSTSHDPLRTFANCAGRLSAQMEFEWMFDGPASEETQARRSAVLDILDAMMRPQEGRKVLNWRIEAKMAQSALLTRSKFNEDDRSALRARLLAIRNLDACNAMLLG